MKNIIKRAVSVLVAFMSVATLSLTATAQETVKKIMYDEAFECDYTKDSGSIKVNEAEVNADGTKSFSILADYSWPRNINISIGTHDLRYANAALHFKVKKERETASSASARIDIKNDSQNIYYIPTVTTEWKEYEVPLTSFLKFNEYEGGFNLSAVKTVQIGVSNDGEQLKYYFDDVYLIMDAQETEPTFTPDVVLFDETSDNISFGTYAKVSDSSAYSGKNSVAIDLTVKDGENRYWLSNGRCINKTVQLSEDVARHGYISFKYKTDTTDSGNILVQFQRYVPEDSSWAMTKNSYRISDTSTWKEAMIPIADLLGEEIDSVYGNGKTLKFISLYTNGNGFTGTLYLDEIGIYYPGISAKLMYNGKRSDYLQSGKAEVNVKVRGIFNSAYNVFAAEYDGERFNGVQLSENKTGSKGESEYTFSFEDGINGNKLKLMAWDSENDSPLAEAYEIGTQPLEVMYYYPEFKEKALTFSCDDGAYASDVLFINLLKKYDLKATFNIVGKWMNNNSTWYTSEAQKGIYDGFEVASHGYTHSQWSAFANDDAAKADLKTNYDYLTAQFSNSPAGFAWPYGDPNNAVLSRYVKELGFEYARPADSVSNFYLPTDWYVWKQKFCSVDNINSFGKDFLNMKYEGKPLICAFWLHSNEWNTDGKFITGANASQQWAVMEEFMKTAASDEKIWSATNIEICRYAKALEEIIIADTEITNPSDTDIYLSVNGEKVTVKAGEKYKAE